MGLAARTRKETPNDVGTLWTMRRSDHDARCSLMERVGTWELRVVVDGKMLLSERCPRGAAAFALAETWKRRMFDDGWRQVLPGLAGRPPTAALASNPALAPATPLAGADAGPAAAQSRPSGARR